MSNTSFLRCLSLRFRGGTLLTSHLDHGPAAQAESGTTLPLFKRSQLHPAVTGLIPLGYPRGQLAGPSRKTLPSRPGCQVKMIVVTQSPRLPASSASLCSFWPISLPRESPFSQLRSQSLMGRGCGCQVGHPKPAGTISQEGVRIGNEPLG